MLRIGYHAGNHSEKPSALGKDAERVIYMQQLSFNLQTK